MRFELIRVDKYSNGDEEHKSPYKQPFPQAILYSAEEFVESYPYATTRPPEEWFAKGKNHEQLPHPYLWRRTLEKRRWIIEFDTLEQFITFYDTYGQEFVCWVEPDPTKLSGTITYLIRTSDPLYNWQEKTAQTPT